MKIKPNCKKCYYGGSYIPNEQLASCKCTDVTEPTVIKFDDLFKKERQYVKRKNWDDESYCEYFIPHLSESDDDFELEAVCTFTTSFDCPFCGENIDVYDIGIEETRLVNCEECGKRLAVKGKSI